MIRRLLPVLSIGLVFSLSPAILAQGTSSEAPGSQPPPVGSAPSLPELTLEECIGRALAKNFALEVQRITTSQAKENVIVAEAAFDSELQVVGSRSVLVRVITSSHHTDSVEQRVGAQVGAALGALGLDPAARVVARARTRAL